MTSTLIRPPTAELQVLTWSRQLQHIRFNEYSALRFLSNAKAAMRNAQLPDCPPIDQFSIAYSGVYALCLGSLYLHSVLPTGKEGYGALALQLGCKMMDISVTDRDKLLNAHNYLQLMTCGYPEEVEDVVGQDMVVLGNRSLCHAEKVFPDWFL